jgi:hypothetical protein
VKLPNAEQAIIQTEKILDYLLSTAHPVGKFKAIFFQSLGYREDDWETLKRDLRKLLARDAQFKERTEYGQKYEVRGTLSGPAGKTAEIITVWIILNGEEYPRFITAYPGD